MISKVLATVETQISRSSRSAARPSGLRLEERRTVVATFITLIEGLYAHLPQKRAAYGHDPVQRLRLLDQKLAAIDDDEFHRSIVEIMTALRDGHTRYIGPAHVKGEVAFLPILIERYCDERGEHYIISKVFAADDTERRMLEDAGFVAEVEVTHWNGVPISRALQLYGERETGGRPDSRRARALESLTLRPLRYSLPPDEDWIVVTFVRWDGARGEVKLTWRYVQESDVPRVMTLEGHARNVYAGNPAAEATRRVKKMLFAPDAWNRDREEQPPPRAGLARSVQDNGQFRDAVSARTVDTPSGKFAYVRLWSFDVNDDDGYLAAVMELLQSLPRKGLILDLRGNPGGLIWAAERLLQLFTPESVSPVRFSMLATDLTRSIASAPQGIRQFEPWRGSLNAAISTGEQYSRTFPLTPPERCTDIGQQYPGPVVAIVDAQTYSAGDLFAAGFVDHRIGTLVSVDEATGAGGANVWYAEDVFRALAGTQPPLSPLPVGVSFTIAFRRATRVGGVEGTEIEDVGIRGRFRRPLTKRDLTDGNRDLIAFCGRLLASEPFTDLVVKPAAEAVMIETTNLDRVDLYVDGRPTGPPHAADRHGQSRLHIPIDYSWSEIEVSGFTGSVLRQRRKLQPQ